MSCFTETCVSVSGSRWSVLLHGGYSEGKTLHNLYSGVNSTYCHGVNALRILPSLKLSKGCSSCSLLSLVFGSSVADEPGLRRCAQPESSSEKPNSSGNSRGMKSASRRTLKEHLKLPYRNFSTSWRMYVCVLSVLFFSFLAVNWCYVPNMKHAS